MDFLRPQGIAWRTCCIPAVQLTDRNVVSRDRFRANNSHVDQASIRSRDKESLDILAFAATLSPNCRALVGKIMNPCLILETPGQLGARMG
jgi:hypothetical protein